MDDEKRFQEIEQYIVELAEEINLFRDRLYDVEFFIKINFEELPHGGYLRANMERVREILRGKRKKKGGKSDGNLQMEV